MRQPEGERERNRERKRESQSEREKERERERHIYRERQKDRETGREREAGRERHRGGGGQEIHHLTMTKSLIEDRISRKCAAPVTLLLHLRGIASQRLAYMCHCLDSIHLSGAR